MKVLEILKETGVEYKQVDFTHWDPKIRNAVFYQTPGGRYVVRYDRGNRLNIMILANTGESLQEFRRRVKTEILDRAKKSKIYDKHKVDAPVTDSLETELERAITGSSIADEEFSRAIRDRGSERFSNQTSTLVRDPNIKPHNTKDWKKYLDPNAPTAKPIPPIRGGGIDESDKLYLNVPFREKDIAKGQYGARWNPQKKKWWVDGRTSAHYFPEFRRRGWL